MPEQHYHASTCRANENIGYLVKRAHSLMQDLCEPLLLDHGVSSIQYIMMAWLRDCVAINPKAFCALYRHDSGAVSRVIDQLAERELLARVRRGSGDRRKIELQLTSAGRTAIEQMIPLLVDKLNLVLSAFSSVEFGELRRLLIKMNTTMQAAVDAAGLPLEA